MARGHHVTRTSQEDSWQGCQCGKDSFMSLGKQKNRSVDKNLPTPKFPFLAYKTPSR